MPPKGKDAKKGAPVGNYKAGKLMKDILPPNSKPPREGAQIKVDGEPDIQRQYAYEPYQSFPEWASNEDAKAHDFTQGVQKNEDGSFVKFIDNSQIYLPPSFKDFEKNDIQWLRPEEYLREIAYDQEMAKRKQEKKLQIKKKKTLRKQSILSIGQAQSADDSISQLNSKLGNQGVGSGSEDKKEAVNKDELQFDMICISYDSRLETEEEVKKRKDDAEKLAALDKNAKKKPAAKGQVQADPLDEPQMIKVPIENTMDMGFLMPIYSKWATSQFQFIKDRSIRDCESRESIWQRIYPQENGIPVVSPSGKYWVKIRFMGKERLVEIDDRMPCDSKKKLMFPRSINNFEIWPQLLLKALLKVYSYKWFSPYAQYDQEVGDGSIVYSLTGLIPEPITIKDFEKDGLELFRKVLSDDHYFNKKTYVTCYCENEFRPKLPSQTTTLKKIDFGPNAPGQQNQDKSSLDVDSEPSSGMSVTSSGRMLNRLRDAATMAISVTTGRKLNIASKSSSSSNVITGFGYALMDVFENQFVDMDSIVKKNDEIEEVKSPFISPQRKKRDKTISKEEWKKKRREEKKREQEEKERREREPPKQYSVIKIKTSVGHYPVMNYLSTFTNDEITEGKRCLLNRMRRPPEAEKHESPTAKVQHVHKHHNGFQLNVQALDVNNANDANQEQKEEEKKNLIEPKTRAAGGVWLLASDFPHSFQHLIVYHNINKYNNIQTYSDKWLQVDQPYIANEKDIVIKLELDEELCKQMQLQQASNLHSLDVSKQSHNNSQMIDTANLGGVDESRLEDHHQQLLPGEIIPTPVNQDQVLLAFAPYPSKEPLPVLPRYLMRLQQLIDDNNGAYAHNISITTNQNLGAQNNNQLGNFSDRPIDLIFKSYLEAKLLNLNGIHADNNCIWLKPNIVAPLGFTIWAAGLVRKISIVPKSEYLIHQKQFYMKSYQSDFLPLEKGKYHLFGKYDFTVPVNNEIQNNDLIMNLKVDIPNDKHLLKYLRIKVIDKNDSNRKYPTQTEHEMLLNTTKLENMVFTPNNGKGYSIIIEGVMPYNTTEGQLQLEVLTNRETFNLEEIQQVEPLEYSDKYFPSKYGIIFKEKVYVGPDHTSATMNIKLKKEGREFDKIEEMQPKLFKVQVLDHGNVIYQKEGYDQITISHFMFRSSHQLPESNADNQEEETKHQYVIQALFDLYEWPECKTENSDSQDITWHLKIYSSETLAIVKDTDKEDREKALKASWEQAEPGRAEKAKRSRLKFIYQQMMARGEELTEEQKAIAMEVRERIRKKDEPEQPVKGGKGAPAKGAPPAKGGAPAKGAPAKGAPAQPANDEEDEKNKRPLPEPDQHVNNEIRSFLLHYKSDRLIHITCDNKSQARQRSEQEKQAIQEQRQKEREQAQLEIEQENQKREQNKEWREKYKEQVIKSDIEVERLKYKENMTQVMNERNKYRDMIAARKDKDKNLQDLIAQDKIDLNALSKAIEEARENLVREEVIAKGEKYLAWLKYCKELEQMLQQALAEKVKENLAAIIERIEREQIVIEPKMLNDAKNNLAKMK